MKSSEPPNQSIDRSKAYQELLSQYESVIRSCCLDYKLDEARIEDLVHDILLTAIKSLPNYRGQAKISSWLWCIAQRQISNYFRNESIRQRYESKRVLPNSTRSFHYPEHVAQQRELIQNLHQKINTLPFTWQQVIRMYYWEQTKTIDIAKHLKIKPSGVRVILHRSRNRLRGHLWSLAG